jgi:serine protease Do
MFSRAEMKISYPLATAAALAVLVCSAAAAADEPPKFVVNCYDQTRDVVSRELASACQGKTVSDAEAQVIIDRRDQRLQHAFGARPQPALEGGKLVSIGTAFFVTEDGRLVTNNHVVDGCRAVSIETTAGDTVPVKVLAVDVHYDLALLQATIKAPAVASFRTQILNNPGVNVATVGYPDQGMPPREPMVTTGKLLELIADANGAARIAIAADVRHGNSGGPLLDDRGQVIGVVNAKINTVNVYKSTGKVVDNLGFGIALPVVLEFLRRNGTAVRSQMAGEPLDGQRLLDLARPYIARAGCWK